MPIPIKCECGKSVSVPDKFAGKRVKCPGCGKAVQVPVADAIRVECVCGRAFRASRKLAGKTVRCPNCDTALQIKTAAAASPAPAPAAAPEPVAAPQPAPAPSLQDDIGFEGDGADDDASSIDVADLTCPKCGAKSQASAKVCMQCGANMETGEQAADLAPKEEEPKKRLNLKLIGIIAAAVIVAAGLVVGGVMFFGGKKGDKAKSKGKDAEERSDPEADQESSQEKGAQQKSPEGKALSQAGIADVINYVPTLARQPRRVRGQVIPIGIRQFIQAFEIENDRYPKSLEELKSALKTAGSKLPDPPGGQEYAYSPKTGKIGVRDVRK